ncbi:MAG TPA: multicopper oxidase domain-containing protein, partial [Longimicrobiales bacterium]|nr:multicopper oxidase domain-containing protein [Longimicrobiales bacterium]
MNAQAADAPRCADPTASGGLPALYCFDLVATPRVREAAGVVEMGTAPSPYGVTVTPEGVHAYDLTARIEGLPDPASLGPYTAFVAWATPLVLDPVVRLGTVGNGENALGRVAFNKFMILVSAEASADGEEREGPLILRGRSPSSGMVAHDLLAQAPSAEQAPRSGPEPSAGHRSAGAPGPPPYPGVPMLPGMERLEPAVRPLGLDRAPGDLPPARTRQVVELPDGGTLDLTAGYVHREIRGRTHAMLAFNGQHPGPLLEVRQASTIFVNFTNDTPFPTTIHWHGLRLDNRFDGVPGVTQDAVEPGGTFRYRVRFPDAGIYWYHPHHREDVQQELGLYGNMLVEPRAESYYGPANR